MFFLKNCIFFALSTYVLIAYHILRFSSVHTWILIAWFVMCISIMYFLNQCIFIISDSYHTSVLMCNLNEHFNDSNQSGTSPGLSLRNKADFHNSCKVKAPLSSLWLWASSLLLSETCATRCLLLWWRWHCRLLTNWTRGGVLTGQGCPRKRFWLPCLTKI